MIRKGKFSTQLISPQHNTYNSSGSRAAGTTCNSNFDDNSNDSDEDDNDAGEDSAMDIDPQEPRAAETSGQSGQEEALPDGSGELQVEGDNDDDSDDEDREDPADVAMVPMADMLNARFESENVSRSSP